MPLMKLNSSNLGNFEIDELLSYQDNIDDIIDNRNMRNLEIFLQTTECILEATQSLLTTLKEEDDQDIIE